VPSKLTKDLLSRGSAPAGGSSTGVVAPA
jgi:hypothetical protein